MNLKYENLLEVLGVNPQGLQPGMGVITGNPLFLSSVFLVRLLLFGLACRWIKKQTVCRFTRGKVKHV
jgi:hypothetical protein